MDKINKDGIYETSLIVKESINIPRKTEAIADFQGVFLSENGNNRMIGQHGVIPFNLSQLGFVIIQACKQIRTKKMNDLLFLAIIFQDLYPINCFR